MNKTAIVIGATGLIGKALVDKLTESEHIEKVITITRSPVVHSSSKVVSQIVDFDQLENYASYFKGDYLFSCLGTTLKQAGTITAQRKVDLDYQLKAAQLAANNGVDHYLLVSSSGANKKSKNNYLKMKGELEEQIKGLSFKHISIFQPSLLLGQRNTFRLGEKIGSWVLPILCLLPWLNRYRPITGEEVAAKMVLTSKQPADSLEYFKLDEIFIK